MDSVLRINSGLLTQPETIHHHTILVFYVSYKNNKKLLCIPPSFFVVHRFCSVDPGIGIHLPRNMRPETWLLGDISVARAS